MLRRIRLERACVCEGDEVDPIEERRPDDEAARIVSSEEVRKRDAEDEVVEEDELRFDLLPDQRDDTSLVA